MSAAANSALAPNVWMNRRSWPATLTMSVWLVSACGLNVTAETAAVDPGQLRRAVANLLDNALRHSKSGGVIRIDVVRTGDAITLAVQDSGPGFPPDLLGRAFEPFARCPSGDGQDGDGAGLGLAIVRAVAEAHGGTAKAENVPEGGARVTLGLRG